MSALSAGRPTYDTGDKIYDHDSSARPFVRDDRESQSSCSDLTEKDGERPADAARITKSRGDPRILSRQKEIPRDSSRCNLPYAHPYPRFAVLHGAFKPLVIENRPALLIEFIFHFLQ